MPSSILQQFLKLLEPLEERKAAYQNIIKDQVDIIESFEAQGYATLEIVQQEDFLKIK